MVRAHPVVDPFTFPAGAFLTRLNEEREQIPLVGGIAGDGRRPGTQALILDDVVHAEGAVGAVVSGVQVRTVVSQDCRPIGREAVITRCQGNVVYELAGLAGLVIDENRPEYETGDYLMRSLLGLDQASGALTLGDTVRVGQTLRFFVRDAASADADLRRALAGALPGERPAGALLFTCNGRGTNMFPEPDHDARVVAAALRTQVKGANIRVASHAACGSVNSVPPRRRGRSLSPASWRRCCGTRRRARRFPRRRMTVIPMLRKQLRRGERDDRLIWRTVQRVAQRVGVRTNVHAFRAARSRCSSWRRT